MKPTEYIQCYNCGKHIPKDEAVREKFCSEECARVLFRCETCGRWFQPKSQKDRFCSLECSQQYEYQERKGKITSYQRKEKL